MWDGEWDPSLPRIRFVQEGERASPLNGHYTMMSNSFAFGGSNASLVFSKKTIGDHTDG